MEATGLASLRIGPAGWSYRDWQGVVYPRGAGSDFDPLAWIAGFFDLVEINVTFYRVPRPHQAHRWVQRIGDTDLHFSAKLPREFTHRWLAPTRPALAPFLEFLAPLAEAGRLDVVLVQFPWSVRPGGPALEHMQALREAMAPHAVVFEVRHVAWEREPWPTSFRDAGLDVVHVDQPALAQNVGADFGPGRRAYVRLHGRNASAWFDPEAGRDARYDWLYSIEDMRGWADRVRELRKSRSAVHVVTNNHFAGQAVVNALELGALLGRPVPRVPAGLLERYPQLNERWDAIGLRPEAIGAAPAKPNAPPRPRQGELFGEVD